MCLTCQGCAHCFPGSGPPAPEHLVQAGSDKEGESREGDWRRCCLETEGETGPLPAAAPHGQTVNAEDTGSLHAARLTRERRKRGQDGQMPDPGHLRHLDTVQLHIQDLCDTVQGHCRDSQLLTAQVYAGFSLRHPPGEVREEVIQGAFLQAVFCVYLYGSQGLVCP